jgi:branched-chain amino acid transport system permease protein
MTTPTVSATLAFTRRYLAGHPMPLFAVALFVLPYLLVAVGLSTFNAAEFLVWGLFALAVNLLWGYGGDLSFGHGMFFGCGAYVAGLISHQIPNMPLALIGAALVSAAVAVVLAAVIVPRAQGIYFAMITLATGQIFYFLAFRMDPITGGETGLGGISRGGLLGLDLMDNVAFYFFTSAVVFLATAAVLRIIRSPFGRVLKGVQQNRARMPYLGFNVVRYRQGAFVLSAALAGLAGGLSSFLYLTVPPERLNWTTTGAAIIMTMLGGLGTVYGPFIGASVYKFLEGYLNPITNYWPALVGLVFAVVVLVAPKGILGVLTQVWRRVIRHRPSSPPRRSVGTERDAA